jgi:tight adherence protein B
MITPRDFWYAAVLSAILVAVILLVMAVHQLVLEPGRKRRKVSRRLGKGFQKQLERVQILKAGVNEKTGWWGRLLGKWWGPDRLAKLRIRMQQADIHQSPGHFVMWSVYLSFLGLLAGFWVLKSPMLGLALAGSLALVPHFYLHRKRLIKTRKFEVQMPDAMELLARSLRAGHTLPSAMELLGEEMLDPMGTEMAIAYEEQQFGISTSEALLHMLERVESMDLRYFVAAVLIQQETGGNLAELMENIAQVIRSRLNFKSKVRGLTAMGRISTTIMIIAPVVAFFGLMLLASQYEKELIVNPIGRIMLMTGVCLVLIGAYLLKRMIQAVES